MWPEAQTYSNGNELSRKAVKVAFTAQRVEGVVTA